MKLISASQKQELLPASLGRSSAPIPRSSESHRCSHHRPEVRHTICTEAEGLPLHKKSQSQQEGYSQCLGEVPSLTS